MVSNVQSMARSNTLREICRSISSRTAYNLEDEPDQYHKEDHIDTININSTTFNGKYSVITPNLKTSSNQVWLIVPYKNNAFTCTQNIFS